MHFAQESGPDEDFQIKSPKLQKVLEDEDLVTKWNRGIYAVEKSSPLVAEFIDNIPQLIREDGVFGLIWNKSLQPSDDRYESGEHFCRTREPERKSVHGSVSFYRDGESGEKFAIKTLQDADNFHCWEIKIGLLCASPHLCAVYGVIVRDQKIHILLEHAGSELLKERSWIAESAERTLNFAKQSFQALQDLHKEGFVHCDIKPDNIMIVRDQGEDFVVKVVDFGSCQPIGGVLPPEAHTTRFYWSPEIWQSLCSGEHVICQPAMDVYALALTLYYVQTSGHLMNMLQERDVLPLMIHRPDDLLLIALPESIPSGLRAVMKPCLASKIEDRWSALQAARQLDGDAMLQIALSNPRGGSYRDVFQQLLLSQSKSGKHQTPAFTAPSSCFVFQAPKVMDVPTNYKPEIQNPRDRSPVHHFEGGSKSSEKKDMGYVIKRLVDKKHPVLAKTGLNQTKRPKLIPKPKKVSNPASVSMQIEPRRDETDIQSHDEVLYISSDETMPSPTKQIKEFVGEKTSDGSRAHSTTEPDVPSITPKLNMNIEKPLYASRDTVSAQIVPTLPCGTDTGHREKSPQEQEVSHSRANPYSCAALLIDLATQARCSSKPSLVGQMTQAVQSNMPQVAGKDRSAGEKVQESYTVCNAAPEPNKRDVIKTGPRSCQLKSQISESLQNLNLSKTHELYQNRPLSEKIAPVSYNWTGGHLGLSGAQVLTSDHGQSAQLTTSLEGPEDDMDFVFQVFDDQSLKGKAEDILDNWCSQLDKAELQAGTEDKATNTNVEKSSLNQNTVNTITQRKEKNAEVMNSSSRPIIQRGRKRMSNLIESPIPAKIQSKYSPCVPAGNVGENLPNFNEILPGN